MIRFDLELLVVGDVLIGASPAGPEDWATWSGAQRRGLGQANDLGFDVRLFFRDCADNHPLARNRVWDKTNATIRQMPDPGPAKSDALYKDASFQVGQRSVSGADPANGIPFGGWMRISRRVAEAQRV